MVRSKLSVTVSIISLLVMIGAMAAFFWVPDARVRADARLAAASYMGHGDPALQEPLPVDQSLIKYHQTAQIPVEFKKVSAMAIDADDHIYVAGDKSLCRLSPKGIPEKRIDLPDEPTCLAVANRRHVEPGRIYVGFVDHVDRYEPDGRQDGVLGQGLGDSARLTSISTSDTYIFIADAGQSVVQRFDWTGKLMEPIGGSTPGHFTSTVNGVNAPFDVAVGLDDLVYVTNRQEHRVEGFNFQGGMEQRWGQGSPAVEDFAGASNPAHLAITADGRFVTAEENPLRVKIYKRSDKSPSKIDFGEVVCGPEATGRVVALAVDSHGRVLILDGQARCVRVFEKTQRK